MSDNHVDPTREAFDLFKSLPRDEPIFMLNMVRFNEKAKYPEGHELATKDWSGPRAYVEYSKTSGPIFKRVGGTIDRSWNMQAMVIGPQDEQWDAIFVAEYPNSGAFLEMVTDEEYRKAVVNRQAAVATSRLIRLEKREGGNAFG